MSQEDRTATAMSSAEAEYMALSASCAQVMWMRTQLKDYGFNYNKIPLYCDSQFRAIRNLIATPVQQFTDQSNIHTRNQFIKEQEHPSDTNVFTMKMEIRSLKPEQSKQALGSDLSEIYMNQTCDNWISIWSRK
ncbi:hypothetical protein Tco_1577179 [Tanacetum coccineum]